MAPNIVQARAEPSLLEVLPSAADIQLVKSAARVTFSRPQLPSWGFANLLAKTYSQRLRLSEPPQAAVPQLGSWGLLAAPLTLLGPLLISFAPPLQGGSKWGPRDLGFRRFAPHPRLLCSTPSGAHCGSRVSQLLDFTNLSFLFLLILLQNLAHLRGPVDEVEAGGGAGDGGVEEVALEHDVMLGVQDDDDGGVFAAL